MGWTIGTIERSLRAMQAERIVNFCDEGPSAEEIELAAANKGRLDLMLDGMVGVLTDEDVVCAIQSYHVGKRVHAVDNVGCVVNACLRQLENYLQRTFVEITPEMVAAGKKLQEIWSTDVATTAEEAVACIKLMMDVSHVNVV